MSYGRQKKNTTKLPKVLRDELVSLGKLDPQPRGKKRSYGQRTGTKDAMNKRPFNKSGSMTRTGGLSAASAQGLKKYAKKLAEEEVSSAEEDDLLNDEDRMIGELEKKLGMDKRKSSKLGDDELDGLLDGIGVSKRGTKRKTESTISDSRAKKAMQHSDGDSSDDYESSEKLEEESEFEGFSERSDTLDVKDPEPEVAVPSVKYIPPAARKTHSTPLPSQNHDPRLQKQIQGLINRLSESNMSTILSEIESLYRNHPRANVTSTLTTLLLTILSAEQSLLETFVILHAGFVAALYRIMGTDFCAYLVQTLVERFDEIHRKEGKESTNLVAFMSELYNFGVVGAGLIYDLIRLFLENLTEVDTELLLKIIQNSGQQLRQDDPSALKDIVILMQSKVSALPPESLSVRTKFMIETIINLKNNRAKAATATSVVNSEATVRMKKFLGKLGEKGLRSGGEPLRVTLSDIRNVNEKGKWWLVGASWKNDELNLQPEARNEQDEDALLSLAREQRMNTEIRRAVFIALMGSEDYIDASTRILLLPLKKVQRSEIPRVIVHCCSNEKLYNPFYSLVARRLCSPSGDPKIARVVRMGLQFNLWGAFREWGETTDEEWANEDADDLDDSAKLRKAVNLAKLYGSLVAGGVLSLQILKVLGFVNLQSLTKTFLEIFFTQLTLHSQGNVATSRNAEPLLQCAHKLNDSVALAKGIDWYLRRKNVEKAGITEGESADCVAWGVGVLRKGISEILQES